MTEPKKKKEVYARCAVQLRTHEKAFEAERRCPGAMGMYLFLQLQARGEATWGDVLEAAALSSWGGSPTYRRKQVEALIAVNLVERREGRFFVVRYGEHNDTPDVIEANREAARKRQAISRAEKRGAKSPSEPPVTRDGGVTSRVTDASVTSSPSSCGSSVVPIARARGDDDAQPPPTLGAPLPDKYRAHADAVAMNKFPDFDADESWKRYVAWCIEQGTRPNEPRWWRWVSEDVERAKNRHLARSSGPRLLEVAPPAKAPYYAEWKPPEPDEELDPNAAREASSGLLRALGGP